MVLMASLLSRPIPEIAHSLIAKPWFIEPQAFRLLLATQFGSDTEPAKAGPGDPQPRNNSRRGRSAVVPVRGIVTAHPIPLFEDIGWTTSGASVVRMVTDAWKTLIRIRLCWISTPPAAKLPVVSNQQ